jgi:class 3 adenylate cyclase
MNYLYKYYKFNESEEKENNSKDNPKRSERLLSQAQKESDFNVEKTGNQPTILFTDVVGSSDMWSNDAVTMMAQLKGHHELVQSLCDKNEGWIVKTIGDAFMVYFEPSEDSLLKGLRFSKQLILNEKNYELRIGVCKGYMQEETYRIQKVNLKDFYGNPVNTASRMESVIAGDVKGVGRKIAFSSISGVSEKELNSFKKEIGEVEEVNLKNYNLKGATTKQAFLMKIKK